MTCQPTCAIIGGGWAGCAAAVELAGQGHRITLFEAGQVLGGRARRLAREQATLDNGQHLLLGVYRETARILKQIGHDLDDGCLRTPLHLELFDGFRLALPRLPRPWHQLVGLLGCRGLDLGEKWAAARLMQHIAQPSPLATGTVSTLLDQLAQPVGLRRRLWEPLCLAALNTPPHQASAHVFSVVLRDALTGPDRDSDLLIPREDLSTLFPEKAARWLQARGHTVLTRARVAAIEPSGSEWQVVLGTRRLGFDRVVLATAPQHLSPLIAALPGMNDHLRAIATLRFAPIVTAYLQYPAGVSLPFAMMGDSRGPVHWAFDRGQLGGPPGLLAAVNSADRHLASQPPVDIARDMHAHLAHRLPALPAPEQSQVIIERRATCLCEPARNIPTATPLPGLALAGDWLDPDYPATLETAVRSGVRAAAWLSGS